MASRTLTDRVAKRGLGRIVGRVRRVSSWTVVTVACVAAGVVAWWPFVNLRLGPYLVGNVAARHGLHLQNIRADGWAGSAWGAAWEPYASAPYAHWPPASNLTHWIVAELFDGPTDFQLLAVQHFYAVAAVAGLVVLARRVGASPWATAAAVTIVGAQSWFFWVAPLGPELAATAWFCVWAVPFVSDRRLPNRRGWWAGLAAGIWGWHTIAAVGVLSAIAAVTHRRRRVGWGWLWPAAGAGCAAVGTAVWALAADTGGLVTHTRRQVGVPDVFATVRDMVEHVTIYDFTGLLTVAAVPLWVVGCWVGRRSTRIVVAGTVGSVIALAGLLSLNARGNPHWPHLLVVPTFVAAAVAGTWLWSLAADGLRRLRIRSTVPLAAAAVLVVAAVAYPAALEDIAVYRYTAVLAEAGDVAVANPPPEAQEWAWTNSDLTRWIAYYWQLPPAPAIPEAVPDTEVAVMRLRPLPDGGPGGWRAVRDHPCPGTSYTLSRPRHLQNPG